MRDFLSTYWLYIRTFLKSRAEYRVGFILGMFANFYCYFITFATYWVIVSGLGNLGGWSFPDLSVLYGLSLITYATSGVLVWYTVYHMDQMITDGSLDAYLVRPCGILQQMIFQRFGDTFLGQILVSSIFLIMAFAKSEATFTWMKALYLMFALVGGILIQCASMILIGSMSFWTLRSTDFGRIIYYDIRSLTQYPIAIFPKWIQFILTFIFPWAFINYYPSLILLEKVETTMELVCGMLSPLVGGFLLLISLGVFKLGLKKYSGAGN